LKPVFTILALCIFFMFMMIYIKDYGIEEFRKYLITSFMGMALVFVATGLIADIVRAWLQER